MNLKHIEETALNLEKQLSIAKQILKKFPATDTKIYALYASLPEGAITWKEIQNLTGLHFNELGTPLLRLCAAGLLKRHGIGQYEKLNERVVVENEYAKHLASKCSIDSLGLAAEQQ